MIIDMKKYIAIAVIFGLFLTTACEKSVEVKIPSGVYDAEKVFENEQTAETAMRGIYATMIASGFTGKTPILAGPLAAFYGMASDELVRATYTTDQQQYLENNLDPESSSNAGLWAGFYSYIYQSNRLIEGLNSSAAISDPVRARLSAEASFVRAMSFFYLTNLYKNIPMPLTSDYVTNGQLVPSSPAEVYERIIEDLEFAIDNLAPSHQAPGDRFDAGHWAAKALLARVYLYLEEWELAESTASDVIEHGGFELEPVSDVFTEESREAIWQLANAGSFAFTGEAAYLSGQYNVTTNTNYRMTPYLLSQFEATDLRFLEWTKIGTGIALGTRAPRKFKVTSSAQTDVVREASVPLRLAEQYLIRAEARAHQGKLDLAIEDVDVIRLRAGAEADPTADFQTLGTLQPTIGKEALIEFIFDERMRELFAENAHRWFDAKRSQKTLVEFFGDRKPGIQESDAYSPIPRNDIENNPNLTQNDY